MAEADTTNAVDAPAADQSEKVVATELPPPPQGKDITPDRDGGVLKEILKPGTGDGQPLRGDTAYVHYVGTLTDGTQFDASRKEKFQFVVGRGSVVKAWDIAIVTMKRGERARFRCLPKYGYGKKGSPPKIPPNATLIFEIELFSWRGEDVSENKDGGVLKSRMKDGTGNPPKEGAVCKIRVTGKHEDRQFLERDYRLTLGEGSEVGVVEGIEQALKGFQSGERAILRIKSRYAYGTEGNEKYKIPPNADVEFDVELMSYDPFKEGWMLDDDEKIPAAEAMKIRGTKYFEDGKYKFAARYYLRVVEYLKEDDHLRGSKARIRSNLMLAAHLNMAACHLKLGNNLEALHACDEALKFDEKSEKAFFRRATAQKNLQNFESAIDDYSSVLRVNPNNKGAREQITIARQKVADMKRQEKDICTKMFQKGKRTEVLKLWKEPMVAQQTTEESTECNGEDGSSANENTEKENSNGNTVTNSGENSGNTADANDVVSEAAVGEIPVQMSTSVGEIPEQMST